MGSIAFDAFTNLAERLLELENAKYKNREELFNEIIQPLFTDLQPTIDNYFSLFRRARALAKKSPRSFRKAIDEIKNAREETLKNRIQVREFADAVSNLYEDQLIKQFAEKVYRFFYSIKGEGPARKSRGKHLVDLFEYVTKDDATQEELIKYIDDALGKMEKSWVEIAESYAHLRIYCLNSKGLKLKFPVQTNNNSVPLSPKTSKTFMIENSSPESGVWMLYLFCFISSALVISQIIFTTVFLRLILGTSNTIVWGSEISITVLSVISFYIGSKVSIKSPASFILIASLFSLLFPYLLRGAISEITFSNFTMFGLFGTVLILFAFPFVSLVWFLTQVGIVSRKNYKFKIYVVNFIGGVVGAILFQQLTFYLGRTLALSTFAFILVAISLWGYFRSINFLKLAS